MDTVRKALALAGVAMAVVFSCEMSLAAESELSKEQIIEQALRQHPGKVEKAYKERKQGEEVWEVEIKGDDGTEHELYYDAKTGEQKG